MKESIKMFRNSSSALFCTERLERKTGKRRNNKIILETFFTKWTRSTEGKKLQHLTQNLSHTCNHLCTLIHKSYAYKQGLVHEDINIHSISIDFCIYKRTLDDNSIGYITIVKKPDFGMTDR